MSEVRSSGLGSFFSALVFVRLVVGALTRLVWARLPWLLLGLARQVLPRLWPALLVLVLLASLRLLVGLLALVLVVHDVSPLMLIDGVSTSLGTGANGVPQHEALISDAGALAFTRPDSGGGQIAGK